MYSPTKNKTNYQYRFLGIITTLYTTMQLVADVTAGKIIEIGGIQVSATVFYFPVTFIFSDILTEVYGYSCARRVLYTVLLSSIISGVIYQLVIFLSFG
jgi:queuosine precursor transporter